VHFELETPLPGWRQVQGWRDSAARKECFWKKGPVAGKRRRRGAHLHSGEGGKEEWRRDLLLGKKGTYSLQASNLLFLVEKGPEEST